MYCSNMFVDVMPRHEVSRFAASSNQTMIAMIHDTYRTYAPYRIILMVIILGYQGK